MKRTTVILTAMLILPIFGRTQDLSSFYQITGFRLPALRTGQYMLSLSPRYSTRSSTFNGTDVRVQGTTTGSGQFSYDSPYSTFRIGSSAIYGLSDRTTISLSVDFVPNQSTGDQISSGNSFDPPSFTSSTYQLQTSKLESFSSSFMFAQRFDRNIEFSLSASYTTQNIPTISMFTNQFSGGGPATIGTDNSTSSSKNRGFDIQANIVILGY